MTWPTVAVGTTNVDSGTDNPANARADILDALQKLNQMIAHVSAFAATIFDDADAAAVRSTISAQASDADLTALAALGSTGIAVRSAADTWVQRSIAGTANQVTLTNGDGVSGNPTVSLPAAITLPGSLAMGGLLDLGATGQIQFPATQNASAGANVLDDYEEGTWTPSLGGTATYNTQVGTYTKIGNIVSVRGRLVVSAIGTGSTITVSGLPFSASGSEIGALGITNSAVLATAVVSLNGQFNAGAGSFTVRSRTVASAGDATNAIFQTSTDISFSGSYQV